MTYLVRLLPVLMVSLGAFSSTAVAAATDASAPAQAQQGSISGRVTDAASGEPLVGAAAALVGSSRGAVTAADGRFTITGVAAGSHRVRITRIGYAAAEQSVAVRAGQPATVNVALRAEAVALEGVVAVGYGTQRRADITGAVSSVKTEGIERTPTMSIEQAIAGKAAGVHVIQASSEPGGGISMRIRGTGSITGSPEPLYVIDGLPIENDIQGSMAGSGGRSAAHMVPPNPLAGLNPNEIESIEVLKDASSTAIYGARGANGVVLITTKQGRTARPRVTFDAYQGMQDVARKVELLNGREMAQFVNMQQERRGLPPMYPDIDDLPVDTDWQDEIFRSAPIQNYQMSVAGATASQNRTRYSLTGGYFDQEGVVLNTQFKRYTVRVNLDQAVGNALNFGANLSANRTNSKAIPTGGAGLNGSAGAINAALQYTPLMPVKRPDGTYTNNNQDGPPTFTATLIANPVATAVEVDDDLGQTQILGNLFGEYRLFPGLKARVSLGANGAERFRDTYYPRTTVEGGSQDGRAIRGMNRSLSWVNENTLTYDLDVGAHDLTFLGGYTREMSETSTLNMTNSNFISDATEYFDIGAGNRIGGPTVGSGYTKRTMESYLGRVNYNLLGRYLFTATGRYDGSSRFGEGRKWGFFPSGAFAWRASAEPFLRDIEALSDLKLRASYGESGNTSIRPYESLGRLSDATHVFNGMVVTTYSPSTIANPLLGWETTAQFDVGMDLALFDNRFNLTADFYDKRTRDLLLAVQLPLEIGIQSMLQNAGTIQNRGVELTVGADLLAGDGTESVAWNTNFTYSRNRNRALDLGGLDEIIGPQMNGTFRFAGSRVRVGQPLGFFYGFKTDGVIRDSTELAAYGVTSPTFTPRVGGLRYVDMNGDKILDNGDRTVIGDPNPDFNLGWQNTLGFKGFELSTLVQGVFGNEVLNINLARLERGQPTHNILKSRFYNAWSPTNPNGKEPALFVDAAKLLEDPTDISLEDGSYLRLRTVTLSYVVPTDRVRLSALSNARVYVTGQNLFTSSDYSGYNPDVSAFGTGVLNSGVDMGAYPLAKSVTVGVSVTY